MIIAATLETATLLLGCIVLTLCKAEHQAAHRALLQEHKECALAGLRLCLAHGITSVQTNDGAVVGGIADALGTYRTLVLAGQLPLRVLLTLPDVDILGTDKRPELWRVERGR